MSSGEAAGGLCAPAGGRHGGGSDGAVLAQVILEDVVGAADAGHVLIVVAGHGQEGKVAVEGKLYVVGIVVAHEDACNNQAAKEDLGKVAQEREDDEVQDQVTPELPCAHALTHGHVPAVATLVCRPVIALDTKDFAQLAVKQERRGNKACAKDLDHCHGRGQGQTHNLRSCPHGPQVDGIDCAKECAEDDRCQSHPTPVTATRMQQPQRASRTCSHQHRTHEREVICKRGGWAEGGIAEGCQQVGHKVDLADNQSLGHASQSYTQARRWL